MSDIPPLTGRITEVGRGADGQNEAVFDIGRGQLVTLRGMSDTVTKALAVNIFKFARIEVTVHDE